MRTLLNDLRFGARMLLKKPGFTLIAILTLALGIGANTAVFSVVNALLLRPLPYPNEQQLVVMNQTRPDKFNDEGGVSYLNFVDWQTLGKSFESMGIVQTDEATLTGEGEPVRVQGAIVSSGFFNALGVAPQLGRAFDTSEDLMGASGGFQSVMITDSAWRNRFGADQKIIGRKLTLGEKTFTVVGVTPAGIFPLDKEPIDFFTTVASNGDPAIKGSANASRGYRAYAGVLARLKPGVTIDQARSEMELITSGLKEKYKEANSKTGISVMPLRELVVGNVKSKLWLLLGIVGAVLLIACVNVANLLLARATARYREMAIRSALGASTRHILQQLFSESLLLSLAGGALGLLLSLWLIDVLVRLLPAGIPRITGLSPDWRVLVFTFGATILTGLLCGIAPAITAAKTDLTEAMKEGGRSSTASASGILLRNSLVIGQVAIALVLLVGAGLLIKSLIRLHQVNPGFETGNILTMQMSLSGDRYFDDLSKPERINTFLSELTGRVGALPGVSEVSFAQSVPLTSVDNGTNFEIVERPTPKGEQLNAQLRFIANNYFQTLSIPTLGGRNFNELDQPQAPAVAIVNEAFAREYFKGENPIGKRLKLGWGGDAPKEIVGIVGNVRHRSLSDTVRPEMYVPQSQFANAGITLLVRSTVKANSLIAAVKQQIYALDSQLPVTEVKTLEEYRSDSVALPRFSAFLLAMFSGLALLLTAIGLYGVMSYSVTQRTHEIGLRIALGAQASDVLKQVIGQGMKLAIAGVAVGLVGAFALTGLIRSFLFGVTATDPLTFALISLLLLSVAALACWIPARRATKVDPIIALRCE